MKNTGMFRRMLMVAIPLALAAPAWASICPGAPTALSPSFTNATGCTVGNNQFSNFAVTSGTTGTINGITLATTTWPTPPTASTIDLNAFGSGIDLTTPGFCGTPTASITPNTFCVGGSATADVISITYDLHAVSGTISNLALDGTVHTHSSGQTGAIATVFREFCLGTTTFSQGCTGYGVLQIGTLNGHNLNQAFSASTIFAGVTDIAIRDTVFLQTFGPTGEYTGVSNFDLTIGSAAPEPATLGLVGLSLAGLGALRFRRRKL